METNLKLFGNKDAEKQSSNQLHKSIRSYKKRNYSVNPRCHTEERSDVGILTRV